MGDAVTAPRARWFVDLYRDQVWDSDDLKADEKAIAETYARWARDEDGNRGPAADRSWVTYDKLQMKAGVRRRPQVTKIVRLLVDKGWLKPVLERSRRPTIYQLTIPVACLEDGTSEAPSEDTTARTIGAGESSAEGTTEPSEVEHETPVVPLSELPDPGGDPSAGSESGTTVVPSQTARSSESGTTVVPNEPPGGSEGGTVLLEDRLPSQSTSPASRSPAHRHVAQHTNANDEEINWILTTIKTRYDVRSLAAYVPRMNPEDLGLLLNEARDFLEDLAAEARAAEQAKARHAALIARIEERAAAAVPIDDARKAHTRELMAAAGFKLTRTATPPPDGAPQESREALA